MANSPTPLYWDTNVFIHRLQRTPQHIHVLEQVTDAAERGEIVFVQSTFTIAELVKVSDDEKLSEKQEDQIAAFFENDFIITRTLTEPIAFLSRKISRDFGIKPGDAVHIATAIFWKVPILHTYDDNLLKKTGLIGDPPLTIEQPSFVGQTHLPLLEFMEGVKELNAAPSTNGAENMPVAAVPASLPAPVSLSPPEGSATTSEQESVKSDEREIK